MVTFEGEWLVGDAIPEPAEGLYWAGERLTGRVLMPVSAIVGEALGAAQPAPRCKLRRAAAIGYARSRWGPAAGQAWAPTAAMFDSVRPAVELLIGHGFWDRLEVLGAGVHLAVRQHDAAVTTDLVVRFADGGRGVMAVWSEPVPPLAAWADLGAAVAALSDAGLPLAKAVVIWSLDDRVRLEAKAADDALAAWVDALDLAHTMRRHRFGSTVQP
jgi:hypothetical protein